jgi:hypothetical protein
MRHFLTLDTVNVDSESGILYLTASSGAEAQVAVRREGVYVAISASHGPLELALRPRFEELERLLQRLQPVEGLQTTRQVGTAQAYLAIGIRRDGSLVTRPTLVADAGGLFTFNLVLAPDTAKSFLKWLSSDPQ